MSSSMNGDHTALNLIANSVNGPSAFKYFKGLMPSSVEKPSSRACCSLLKEAAAFTDYLSLEEETRNAIYTNQMKVNNSHLQLALILSTCCLSLRLALGVPIQDRDQFPLALMDTHPIQIRSQRLCGEALINSVRLICNDYFKRSGKDMDMSPESPPDDDPFLPRQSALDMLKKMYGFHRVTRGIYDECCAKPCSIPELRAYCGKP